MVATEIFRWSIFIPKCAISALSTFRTVCFGGTSALVSTWIASNCPFPLVTIRELITPANDDSSSSAADTGKTLPAIGDADLPPESAGNAMAHPRLS